MIVASTTRTHTVIRRPRLSGGAALGAAEAGGVAVGSVIRRVSSPISSVRVDNADVHGDEDPDPDGLAVRIGRLALGPARAAARSGRSAIAGEAERAVDGAFAGPLPEAVVRALVDHRVLERMLAEALEATAAAKPATAAEREQVQQLVDQLVERVLASPTLERIVVDALGSRLTEDLA